MSTFLLKIIACIFMVIDHIGMFIPGMPIWLRWVGRISAPIFLFCMIWGIHYTRNKKTYLIRMYVFSIAISIVNTIVNCFLVYNESYTNFFELSSNIFTTLFAISFYIIFNDYCRTRENGKKLLIIYWVVQIVLAGLIFILSDRFALSLEILRSISGCVFYIDYGFMFYTLGLILNKYKDNKRNLILSYSLFCLIYFLLTYFSIVVKILNLFYLLGLAPLYMFGLYACEYMLGIPNVEIFASPFTHNFQWMMICSLPFILCYNNKKGYDLKYFFYFFYPLHIYLLYLIGTLI